MSELILLSTKELEQQLTDLNKNKSIFEESIRKINRDVSNVKSELTSRFLVKRYNIINNYKNKLKNILSQLEYDIVIENMDNNKYSAGNMIMIDIENIYNDLLKYKNKFTGLTLKNLYISDQLDTYPPRSSYKYKFIIEGFSDVIIGSNYIPSMNSKIFENTLKIISENSEFDFLNVNEKKNITFFTQFNKLEVLIKHLPRLKEIKNIFPKCNFNGIDIVDDNPIFYVD